jgi:hypothetical protein
MWRFISYYLTGLLFGFFPLFLFLGEMKWDGESKEEKDRDVAAFMMGLISGLALIIGLAVKYLA